MTFFKKAAKKTISQGISAWFLYEVFHFINNAIPEDSFSFTNLVVEKFLFYVGVPALATFGFEDLFSRLTETRFEQELAGINLSVVLITALTSTPLSAVKMEHLVPFTLYVMGIYYHFIAEGDGFLPLVDEDHSPAPRRYLI